MNRKQFITQSSLATAGILLSTKSFSFLQPAYRTGRQNNFPVVRIEPSQRKFTSEAVEKIINEIQKSIGNKELAWLFGNCFPNTLDTTVDFEILNGKPDTYVITGDIDAMWLRDSSAQIYPYLTLCKEDKKLQQLIQGVIHRQAKCILKDPYANAFYKDENKISEWKTDLTEMKPGIHERKWEVDSLCYPIRLSYGYWQQTRNTSAFDEHWLQAMNLIIKTFKEQQRFNGKGPYSFQRTTAWATDGVPLGGYGYPVKPDGLICSMFRPSDDATIFPYLIPSNLFAAKSLQQLSELANALQQSVLAKEALQLCNQVNDAVWKNAVINTKDFGEILAYEINGFGSFNLMDDANVPSLLSLPYLLGNNITEQQKNIIANTRKFILSNNNPFFFKGTAGEGIGGPHAGMNMIWHLSIIMRGLTSTNDVEIKNCLRTLQQTHAGTGFMHESFYKDDATKFTRKWFAWANTLFGEFVLKIYKEKKYLLS